MVAVVAVAPDVPPLLEPVVVVAPLEATPEAPELPVPVVGVDPPDDDPPDVAVLPVLPEPPLPLPEVPDAASDFESAAARTAPPPRPVAAFNMPANC